MARRKLSMQGRILAAGLSVGVVGALAGFMAAGDHTASASAPSGTSSSHSNSSFDSPANGSSSTSNATPYGDSQSGSTTNDAPQYTPQPQTRTGGS